VQKKVCQELTPEQKKTFDDLMKKQQQHMKPAATNSPPQALEQDEEKCPDICLLRAGRPTS